MALYAAAKGAVALYLRSLEKELRRGGSGTMTGFAYPEVLVAIWRCWQAGDRAGAAGMSRWRTP